MNRIIITLLAIIVVIAAMFTAVMVFTPKHVEEKSNIETKIAEEEILDDCTDEYEEMEYENTVKANTRRKNIT